MGTEEKVALSPEEKQVQKAKKDLEKKIEYWKEKLLDLSKRNRLISFKDYKGSTLFVYPFSPTNEFVSFLEGKDIRFWRYPEPEKTNEEKHEKEEPPSFSIKKFIESDELKENKKDNIWLPNYNNKESNARIYKTYLRSRSSLREQGVNTLFVAFGFLRYQEPGQDRDSEKIEAPLLLAPAKIERERTSPSDKLRYTLSFTGGDVVSNLSLSYKLERDFGIELPEINLGDEENGDEEDLEREIKSWMKEIEVKIERKGWSTEQKMCIGIFSFQKQQLYEDIEKNKTRILDNKILQVLSGAPQKILDTPPDIPKAEELDEKVDPESVFQVLDADSSQQKVIEAAKRGLDFVVQGPPGTGKSQTIVNIISEFLAQDKRVLFVSQKAAALNVVKKRLDKVGLGRYCLELHSHKASKKAVINQLEKQLSEVGNAQSTRPGFFKRLKSVRGQLNKFGEEILKKRGGMEKSFYEAVWDYEALSNVPDIDFDAGDIFDLSKERFIDLQRELSDLSNYNKELESYYDNPWRGLVYESITLERSDNLSQSIKRLHSWSNKIVGLLDEVKEICGADVGTENFKKVTKEMSALAKNPELLKKTSKYFKGFDRSEIEDVGKLAYIKRKVNKMKNELSDKHKEEFFNLDAEEILKKLYDESSFYERWTNPEFFKNFYKILRSSKQVIPSGVKEDLERLALLNREEDKEKELSKSLKIDQPNSTAVDRRVWQLIEKLFSFVSTYQTKLSVPELSESLIKSYVRLREIRDAYKFSYSTENLERARKFSKLFDHNKGIDDTNIRDFRRWLQSLHESSIDEARSWVQFRNTLDSIPKELDPYIKKALETSLPSDLIPDAYRKSVLKKFIGEIQKKVRLKQGDKLDSLLQEFKRLDSGHQAISIERIISALEENKPSLGSLVSGATSEVSTLKREINKSRRHKPLRKLFPRISNLLFTLKPCFMMSPLSVAQYIDLDTMGLFDLVIFDEASQIMVEDAVSCLIRAKQAIIVGDSKQLPPTRFFMDRDTDIDIDEEIEDLDSLLSEADPRLRDEYLRWHYRSKDESLIAFSNRRFYRNRLVTFPNNKEQGADKDLGIKFIYLEEGWYDRGKDASRTNPKEAEEVVKLLESQIKRAPEKSVGVVTFSISQQRAVLERVEEFRRDHPEYSDFFTKKGILNEFFVKNLERVQGDERDVMIFSIGYGPDQTGRMTKHFGTINRKGGYKRLNVAITRAREKVYLISSFQPEVIDLTQTSNEGVKHLIHYMKYAKHGPEYLNRAAEVPEITEFDSEFEEVVYDSLTERGLNLATQVGVSGYRIDLAVKNPNKKGEFILGIECDGALYHSSTTARDRDRIRETVLTNLGWEIHRIWSSDWLNNRKREIEKIENKVENLLSSNHKEEEENNEKENYIRSPQVEYGQNEGAMEFDEYHVSNLNRKYRGTRGFHKAYYLGDDFLKIIKKESPITKKLFTERVRSTWGMSRAGSKIRSRIRDTLARLEKREEKIEVVGDTIWYGTAKDRVRFRRAQKEENKRPIDLIPPIELGGLILQIVKSGFSIKREDISMEVARQLGYKRTGKRINGAVNRAVELLLQKNILVEKGDLLSAK